MVAQQKHTYRCRHKYIKRSRKLIISKLHTEQLKLESRVEYFGQKTTPSVENLNGKLPFIRVFHVSLLLAAFACSDHQAEYVHEVVWSFKVNRLVKWFQINPVIVGFRYSISTKRRIFIDFMFYVSNPPDTWSSQYRKSIEYRLFVKMKYIFRRNWTIQGVRGWTIST